MRNPEPVNEGQDFSLDDLDPDVRAYLENKEALYELPIDRLRRMNPLAIELYKMHGTDLTKEPLEFAMNNQHMNGGILINDWGQTSLDGCYAIGEAAGSHGVTRPGGAALNSGQVFGKRVAVAIKRSRIGKSDTYSDSSNIEQAIQGALKDAESYTKSEGGLDPKEVKTGIQARMSDYAGIICSGPEVKDALKAARDLRQKVESEGIKVNSVSLVGHAFRWKHMTYVSEAVLTALDHYIENGGGSRGARAICSDEGEQCPEAHTEDLSRFRFIEEQAKDKEEKLVVNFENDSFHVSALPIDSTPNISREFFEKGWGPYLVKEG